MTVRSSLLLFALAVTTAAHATTYYVSLKGDETDPTAGYETGYTHPQAAIDAAVAAGVSEANPADILVDDGTYTYYTLTSVTTMKPVVRITSSYIRLKARNSRQAILDGMAIVEKGGYTAVGYRPLTIASGLTGVEMTGFTVKRGTSVIDDILSHSSCIYAQSGLLTDMDIQGYWTSGQPMVVLGGSTVVSNFTFSAPIRQQYNSNRGIPCCIYLGGNAKLYDGVISNIAQLVCIGANPRHYQAVYMASAGNLMRSCLVKGHTNGQENPSISWETGYDNVMGGGVYASAGTIESCTIIGNTAWGKGGGIYINGPVTMRNTIVWGNSVKGPNADGTDIYVAEGAAPTIEYCDASTGVTAGENGNQSTDPRFSGDGVTPSTEGVLPGTGSKQDWMVGEKDLAGNARIWTDDTVTPGAYEPQGRVSVFADFSTADGITVGHAPLTVNFTSEVSVEKAGTTYTWTFGDGTGLTNVTESAPSHTYQNVGRYDVELSVNVPGVGIAKVGPKEEYIVTGSDRYYVSLSGDGTDPTAGYATGFTHPQAAIIEATNTGTSATSPVDIYVDDGTYGIYEAAGYAISNRVITIPTSGIRLHARNSRKAILDGGTTSAHGSIVTTDYRPVTIASGLAGVEMNGFVIKHGVTRLNDSALNCASSIYAYSGLLHDMDIRGYWVSGAPMVVLGGTTVLSNFTFTVPYRSSYNANRGNCSCIYLYGNAMLCNGAISNITAFTDYMFNPPRYQAVFMSSSDCAMRNCLVQGNTCGKEKSAGSADAGWNNALGGGVYASAGTIENCTITGNTAWGKGGGIYIAGNVAMRNTIVWGNSANGPNADGADIYVASGTPTVENCDASTGVTAGENGNISADPKFVEDGTGYRIANDSPCVNAGARLDWCARRGLATDLDGQERCRARPDIGCHEAQRNFGLAIFVK